MVRRRGSKDQPQEVPGDGGRPSDESLSHSPKLSAWFGANDSSTANVAGWDVNAVDLGEALLWSLSQGVGVWFGMTRDNGSVTITFVDGEVKARKYAGDSVEFDDVFLAVLRNKPKSEMPGKAE